MADLIAAAMPPSAQRYRTVCVACKAQFTFTGDEVDRAPDAGLARCSTTCPGCRRRVQWTEQQSAPVPLPDAPTVLAPSTVALAAEVSR